MFRFWGFVVGNGNGDGDGDGKGGVRWGGWGWIEVGWD